LKSIGFTLKLIDLRGESTQITIDINHSVGQLESFPGGIAIAAEFDYGLAL
jgi:hypothetical protein